MKKYANPFALPTAPIPRPYGPDGLDRRMVAPPDGLDRRMVAPPDGLDRRMVAPPGRFDRRMVTPPLDFVVRRALAPPEGLERRTMAPSDGLDRGMITPPPPEFLERRTIAPPDGLERRTIALSDGTVRTYFALPPDPVPRFARPPAHHLLDSLPQALNNNSNVNNGNLSNKNDNSSNNNNINSNSNSKIDSSNNNSNKRKSQSPGSSAPKRRHEEEDERISKREKTESKESERERKKSLLRVEKKDLTESFLKFSKIINENPTQKKNYLENGKHMVLRCAVCGRDSKDFKDMHALITHAYYSQNIELHAGHRGLHRALCVLMGWDYAVEPKSNKKYQDLPESGARANKDDLILWPPTVIIQNTNSSMKKEGRLEGMGNKEIDLKLKEMGFEGGKAKSLYAKEGHLGITLVRFSENKTGLKEAERLAEFFAKTNQGRENWIQAQKKNSKSVDYSDKNPDLIKVYASGLKRVLYGYVATASDLEIFDSDAKKRATVKSRSQSDFSD